MKPLLIISFFTLLCGILITLHSVAAKAASGVTPATHMWVQTGTTLSYVPVRSLEQCKLLTRQAARISSSTSHCYNNEALLQKLHCQKATKKDDGPDCQTE